MTLDYLVSTASIKEKLRTLSTHLPNQPAYVYQFASYVAGRLPEEIALHNLGKEISIHVHNLEAGIDNRTGEPIRNDLVGKDPFLYTGLLMKCQIIEETVSPPDLMKSLSHLYDDKPKH